MKNFIIVPLIIMMMSASTPEALSQSAKNIPLSGNEVGNGGDIIICPPPAEGLWLLDLYEAKNTHQWKIIELSSNSFNLDKEVKNRLLSLARLDAKLSQQYLKRWESFWKDVVFEKNNQLIDLHDSSHLSLPKNCQLKQVVIKKNNPLPGEKIFLFQEELWKKLTPTHQVALILHEIIYEHLKFLGENDSRKARFLVGLISSHQFESMTPLEFKKLLQDLKLAIYPD